MLRRLLLPLILIALAAVGWYGFTHEWFNREPAPQIVQRVSGNMKNELQAKGMKAGNPVFIRIFKESNELEVWLRPAGQTRFRHFKTYPILKWSGTLGPKLKEGDNQAPEGFYYVTTERLNPTSRFHLAFNLGYPNQFDQALGRTGSAIMVHGNKVSIGCFAMGDPAIEEIYTLAESALKGGQPNFAVHCFPFRMTADAMTKHNESPWQGFWQNLKTGYDQFEKTKLPPSVTVADKQYVFSDGN
jgi:murein L,D-transpeptidase YafK